MSSAVTEVRLQAIESLQTQHLSHLLPLQLRSQRRQKTLEKLVTSLFRSVLSSENLVCLDRVHRALGPKLLDPGQPRDFICRLQYYSQKEAIVRKAWNVGSLLHAGVEVKILPDLTRATLHALTPL